MQTSIEVRRLAPMVMSDPFAELRRELMNWAEPVIADRVLDGYRGASVGLETTRILAGQHRRLWRAILLEKRSAIESLRLELMTSVFTAELDQDLADGIDQSVIEELIDIVLKRFRSSERIKAFSMILLGAASHISPSRSVTFS